MSIVLADSSLVTTALTILLAVAASLSLLSLVVRGIARKSRSLARTSRRPRRRREGSTAPLSDADRAARAREGEVARLAKRIADALDHTQNDAMRTLAFARIAEDELRNAPESLRSRRERSVPVPDRPAETSSPAEAAGDHPLDPTGLGERVSTIIDAARRVADQIRVEAQTEAGAIRREAELAASASKRALEREAARLQAAPGAQGASQPGLREAEIAARRRRAELEREARSLEARLQAALTNLREITGELERVLGGPEEKPETRTVLEALD
jgi:hypothetical protein